MVTYSWADLEIPEASLLADLNGISSDFQTAQDLAKKLLAERAADKPNWSLSEPFSIAIAVMYSRPFHQGVRHSLGDTDLAILPPALRQAHDYLWHYRNKHVAHSVNSFEENQPRAYYCEERVKQEGITSISCGGSRLIGMSVSDLENVIELTTFFGAHIGLLIVREQDRLLPIVREMPLETVLAGGRKAFSGGDRGAVSKDRKKLAVRKIVRRPARVPRPKRPQI